MSDEHGFAPDPHEPERDRPGGGRHALPEYAAGDTGTRVTPIVPFEEQPEAASSAAASGEQHLAESAEDPYAESAVGPDAEYGEQEAGESVVPLRGGRRAAPRRTRRGRGLPGCLAALVAVVVVLALVWVGGSKGYHFLKDHVGGSAADYAGPGSGSVTFEVHQGDSATAIGRNLKSDGVVASVDAFTAAARNNPDSGKIQVGFYQLKKQMKAADVLGLLVDPKNVVKSSVLVREGLRASDIVTVVAKAAGEPAAKAQRALASVTLPATAAGNPEGYLYPATYAFGPHATSAQMFAEMVKTWQQQTSALGLADTSIDGHRYTVQQLLTVASLVQSEGKTPADMAKIARVIYNRIEHPGAQGQAGVLQIDATVDYALQRPLTVGLTQAERDGTDSPYNTFLHAGLPPGPIGNPGAAAIKAALHPADGDWYYYVTVNLATGQTKFAHTYAEFQQYVAEHQSYCATKSASGCK